MDGYQRRKQEKRDSIKRAALELFAVFGVKKTSVAEIAKRAGANPVTIYNHFADKTALAREIVQDIMASEWKRYKEILSGTLSFQEKLGLIVAAKTDPAESVERTFMQLVLAEDTGAAELVGAVFEKDINPAIVKFIKTGQRSGDVRNDLSVESVRLYIEMFTDLSRTHPEIISQQSKASKTAREIWSLFLFGLLGRKEI